MRNKLVTYPKYCSKACNIPIKKEIYLHVLNSMHPIFTTKNNSDFTMNVFFWNKIANNDKYPIHINKHARDACLLFFFFLLWLFDNWIYLCPSELPHRYELIWSNLILHLSQRSHERYVYIYPKDSLYYQKKCKVATSKQSATGQRDWLNIYIVYRTQTDNGNISCKKNESHTLRRIFWYICSDTCSYKMISV